jgi:hypothetical protein
MQYGRMFVPLSVLPELRLPQLRKLRNQHSLPWSDAGFVEVLAQATPRLDALDIRQLAASSVPLLARFTHLSVLDLNDCDGDTAVLFGALEQIKTLTGLVLRMLELHASDDQWSRLFSHLPSLTSLQLIDLEGLSLSFLGAPPVCSQLRELTVGYLRRPMSEYRILSQLIHLTQLHFGRGSFVALHIGDLIDFLRPSAVLAKLMSLSFDGDAVCTDGSDSIRSSWEWSPESGVMTFCDDHRSEDTQYPERFRGFRTEAPM